MDAERAMSDRGARGEAFVSVILVDNEVRVELKKAGAFPFSLP